MRDFTSKGEEGPAGFGSTLGFLSLAQQKSAKRHLISAATVLTRFALCGPGELKKLSRSVRLG